MSSPTKKHCNENNRTIDEVNIIQNEETFQNSTSLNAAYKHQDFKYRSNQISTDDESFEFKATDHILKETKKVSFSRNVRVCLIPCRKEYESIRCNIWWDAEDFGNFKVNAFIELMEIIETRDCSLKEAISVSINANILDGRNQELDENCSKTQA